MEKQHLENRIKGKLEPELYPKSGRVESPKLRNEFILLYIKRRPFK
jgi:hypothetical protein